MKNPKADITKRSDGNWQSKIQGNDRASFVTKTQEEAYRLQRDSFRSARGGEIAIHGLDGKIRDSNTIAPMRDYYPPKG